MRISFETRIKKTIKMHQKKISSTHQKKYICIKKNIQVPLCETSRVSCCKPRSKKNIRIKKKNIIVVVVGGVVVVAVVVVVIIVVVLLLLVVVVAVVAALAAVAAAAVVVVVVVVVVVLVVVVVIVVVVVVVVVVAVVVVAVVAAGKKKGIVGSKGNRFKNKSGWGGAGGRAQRLPPQCVPREKHIGTSLNGYIASKNDKIKKEAHRHRSRWISAKMKINPNKR